MYYIQTSMYFYTHTQRQVTLGLPAGLYWTAEVAERGAKAGVIYKPALYLYTATTLMQSQHGLAS